MDIYTDYANWKVENYDIIKAFITLKSKVISRFAHVIAVVDYLYNKRVEEGSLEEYLDIIFESGVSYITNHFMTISNILKSEYRNNVTEMDKNAKTINLLLLTDDYMYELKLIPNYSEDDYNKLSDFETKVYSFVESHKEIPDEYFLLLDDMRFNMFEGDFKFTNDIFYEIAIELDLVDSPDSLSNIDMIFGEIK